MNVCYYIGNKLFIFNDFKVLIVSGIKGKFENELGVEGGGLEFG